jgi:hypothetical protein
VPAIGDISIEIGEGEAVGPLGPTAPASTTLRHLRSETRRRDHPAGTDLASLPPHRS